MTLTQMIMECKTAAELNSLRLAIVKDMPNFKENQAAFRKMSNRLARIPRGKRCDDFGKIYDSNVEQREVTE